MRWDSRRPTDPRCLYIGDRDLAGRAQRLDAEGAQTVLFVVRLQEKDAAFGGFRPDRPAASDKRACQIAGVEHIVDTACRCKEEAAVEFDIVGILVGVL